METLAGYILSTGLNVQFWAWVVVGSVIFGALFHVALNVVRAIEPAKSARMFIAEMLSLIPEEIYREDRERAYKRWSAQADKENGQLRERLARAWRQKDELESRAFHYQTRVEELTEKNARLEVAIRSWKSMIERSGVQ